MWRRKQASTRLGAVNGAGAATPAARASWLLFAALLVARVKSSHGADTTLVNLVTNPSFEQLSVAAGNAGQTVVNAGLSNSSTIITGWSVTDGQVSVWKSLYTVSYHGTNSLLLGLDCRSNPSITRCTGGSVSSPLSLTAGHRYSLSFFVAAQFSASLLFARVGVQLQFSDGSQQGGEFDVDTYKGAASDPLGWVQIGPFVFTCPPTSTSATLTLSGITDPVGASPPYVDQVSVLPLLDPGFTSQTKFDITAPLFFSGHAVRNTSSSAIILLPGAATRLSGMTLYSQPLYLTDYASDNVSCTPRNFSTAFTFLSSSASSVEGFTFALLPDPTLGAPSFALGFGRSMYEDNQLGRFRGAVAVEFDGVRNPRVRDINACHVGLNVAHCDNGTSAGLMSTVSTTVVNAVPFATSLFPAGVVRKAYLSYDGANRELSVFVDAPNSTTPSTTPILVQYIDLCDVFGAPHVPLYVGFTAGSNVGTSSLSILSWNFTGPTPQGSVPAPSPPPTPPAPPPTPSGLPTQLRFIDYLSLLNFARDVGGFSSNDTWRYALPCVQWQGITCDSSGIVVALNLTGSGISASLPSRISALSGLTSLDLSYNQISGSIPSTLSVLTNLVNLNLQGNLLTDPIPTNISLLTNLSSVDLSMNKFTSVFPTSLLALTWLKSIRLDSNSITDTIPAALTNFSSLVGLYMSNNNLYGSVPTGLASLSNLTALDLSSNSLTGSLPNGFASPAFRSSAPDGSFFYAMQNNFFTGSSATTASNGDYFCPISPYSSVNANCLTDSDSSYVDACSATSQRNMLVDCVSFCNVFSDKGACGGNGQCYIDPATRNPACLCNAGFTAQFSTAYSSVCVPTAQYVAPPTPNITTTTTGLLPSLTAPSSLNRFSRFVSAGFSLAKDGSPDWSVVSSKNVSRRFPPVRDQAGCSACWAIAASDTIAATAAILRGIKTSVPALSAQQLIDCPVGTTGCTGGWAGNALDYAVTRPNVLETAYPLTYTTGTCNAAAASDPSYYLEMYEQVSYHGWFGVLLVAQYQPVIVSLDASTSAFKNYSGGFIFADPACYTGAINHHVVIVGYELNTVLPYWIVRNSWGTGWGDYGYMRLAIAGGDGICGINVLPAVYPVIKMINDPCFLGGTASSIQPPCGTGTCTATGNYSSTCSACPTTFKPANNTVLVNSTLTQTCAPVGICGMLPSNPCVVGTCVNDGSGSYNCICPMGYQAGSYLDGSPTCVYNASVTPDHAFKHTIRPGQNCYLIGQQYGLTPAQLMTINKALVCNVVSLLAGRVITLLNRKDDYCALPYSVAQGDTCASMASKFGLNVTSLQQLNPALKCTNLPVGMIVCMARGSIYVPPKCALTYSLSKLDTCATAIANARPKTTWPDLYALNPGLNCNNVVPTSSRTTPGQTVCIRGTAGVPGPLLGSGSSSSCNGTYTVKKGDLCYALVAQLYSSSFAAFHQCNQRQCRQIRLGDQLCLPFAATNSCN